MNMKKTVLAMLGGALVSATVGAADVIVCEGEYDGHLQGVATDGASIYWSHTKTVVKTDLAGKVLCKVRAPRHQGDLCFHDGTVYVAVNLGKFNTHADGDSWVFAYDAQTLKETKRWKLPEMVHGAGGMTWANGHFFVIGGLPLDIEKNFVYEYTPDFAFVKRHELDTGFTHMGIQTAAFEDGRFLFGIYGDVGDPVGTLECPPALDSFVRRTGPGNVGMIKLNGEFWTGRVMAGSGKGIFRGKVVRTPGFPACEKVYAPAKTDKGEVRFFYEGRDTTGWKDAGYRFDPNGNAPLFAPKKRRLYATAAMVAKGKDLPAVGLGRNMQVNDLVRGVRRVAETGAVLAFHVPGTPETLKDDPEVAAQVEAIRAEAVRLGVKVR